MTHTDDDRWPWELIVSKREHGSLVRQRITEFPAERTTVQSDFVDAIIEDRNPLCDAADGVATIRIIEAIYESSRTGGEVRL